MTKSSIKLNNKSNLHHKNTVKVKNKKPIKMKKSFKNKKTFRPVKKVYKRTRKNKQKNKINMQTGGDIPLPVIIKDVNFFEDGDKKYYDDIDEYLNPVYGCIMNEIGYIENNYYLAKEINGDEEKMLSPEMKYMKKILTVVPPNVRPTIDIMKYISPYNIGRFIACLYFYNKTNNNENKKKNDEIIKDIISGIKNEENDKKDFPRAFGLLTSLFKSNNTLSKEMFHIVLYCLWWTCNDINGIKEYYKGLNKTFGEINEIIAKTHKNNEKILDDTPLKDYNTKIKTLPLANVKKLPIINVDNNVDNNKTEKPFEKLVGEIITKINPIKIIKYEYAKNFFNDSGKYPDCVETTMRNFINLLIYDGVSFNIDKIKNYLGINDKMIEYYKVFNSPESQLSLKPSSIYGQMLNARDAWSYLIIHHANKNISFNTSCNEKKCNNSCNIKSGVMNKDESQPNFFQLLENLTGKTIKDGIITNQPMELLNKINTNIKSFKYNGNVIKDGKGNIIIGYNDSKLRFEIDFNMKIGHSHASINGKIEKININPEYNKNKYINYLLGYDEDDFDIKKITYENYLWFKYTNETLEEIYKIIQDKKLKYKFLELSASELLNEDTRSRIKIDTDNMKNILENVKSFTKYANDFTYLSEDFKFVDEINGLTILKHRFKYRDIDKLPDLTPLKNIKSIGNGFALNCESLKTINLSGLNNLESIGNDFARHCYNIKTIDLSGLTNLKSIGVGFVNKCISLTTLDLSGLTNLESIGNMFARFCSSLTTIDLSGLTNLKSIGSEFAYDSGSLATLKLSGLTNLESIGSEFARFCSSLTTIDLSGLTNLKSIGSEFAYKCDRLNRITLHNLPALETIGNNFAIKCQELTNLNMSNLPSLKSIGNNFAKDCIKLKLIDLSPFKTLETINSSGFAENTNREIIILMPPGKPQFEKLIRYKNEYLLHKI